MTPEQLSELKAALRKQLEAEMEVQRIEASMLKGRPRAATRIQIKPKPNEAVQTNASSVPDQIIGFIRAQGRPVSSEEIIQGNPVLTRIQVFGALSRLAKKGDRIRRVSKGQYESAEVP